MLGIREFLVAAVVAAGIDEFLGGGEIGLRADPFLRIFFLAEEEAGAVEVGTKSREGRPRIAHRFIGGIDWVRGSSPVRDGRKR